MVAEMLVRESRYGSQPSEDCLMLKLMLTIVSKPAQQRSHLLKTDCSLDSILIDSISVATSCYEDGVVLMAMAGLA